MSNQQTSSKTPSILNSFSKSPHKESVMSQPMENKQVYELQRTSYYKGESSNKNHNQSVNHNNSAVNLSFQRNSIGSQNLTNQSSYNIVPQNGTASNNINNQNSRNNLNLSTSHYSQRNVMSNNNMSTISHNQNNSISAPEQWQLQTNDIKQQIRIIFVFYASFGDRTNITHLKSNRFHKMMQDAQIYDNVLTKNKLDLIFVQENKHQSNMTFSVFLNILPKIASLKYPDTSPEKALLELFFNHLQPLNQSILSETDLGSDLEYMGQQIDSECIRIMAALKEIFTKIYLAYFPWEPCNSLKPAERLKKSQQTLFEFLKDYDICPKTLTKSLCFILFNDIIDTPVSNITHTSEYDREDIFGFPDVGTLFTLNRFLVYIIKCAQIGFSQNANPNFPYTTQAERLNALLERMELSEGFHKFEKKTHNTHSEKTTLLIPKPLLNKLSMEGSLELSLVRSHRQSDIQFRSQRQLNSQILMESKIFSRCKSPDRSQAKSTLLDSLNFNMNVLPVLQKYSENLQRLFKYYCSYGEPLNCSTLKSSKLLKLLRDAGLVKENPSYKSMFQMYRKSTDASRMSNSQFNNSIYQSESKVQNQTGRYIKVLDIDFIFAKLTGHGWIKNYEKKTAHHSKSVKSPSLGFSHYQYKNQNTQGARGKLEYEHFLKCLEEIATKLFVEYDTEQALTIIIENQLLPLDQVLHSDNKMSKTDYLQVLMNILQDSDLVEILSDIHKSLFVYYRHYSDSRGQMNIQQFIQFANDFEIFPDLMSKSKLHTIFFSLSSLYKANEETEQQQQSQINIQNSLSPQSHTKSSINQSQQYFSSRFQNQTNQIDQPEDDYIDQHLFVEATALIACETYQMEPILAYRQLMLIERINSSKGSKAVQMKLGHTRSPSGISWDLLAGLRNKYREFYKSKTVKSKLFQPGNFDSAIENALNSEEFVVQYNDNINFQSQQQHQQQQENIAEEEDEEQQQYQQEQYEIDQNGENENENQEENVEIVEQQQQL